MVIFAYRFPVRSGMTENDEKVGNGTVEAGRMERRKIWQNSR